MHKSDTEDRGFSVNRPQIVTGFSRINLCLAKFRAWAYNDHCRLTPDGDNLN